MGSWNVLCKWHIAVQQKRAKFVILFIQIFWRKNIIFQVWAIDNRRQVYVRSKITVHMPIGRQWVHVPG